MFGALLNLCGYDLEVGKHEFVNACVVEHHAKVFNAIRNHGWTHRRLMDETGMKSIDEGVSLNQLIEIYSKCQIGYHVVDFKYHTTSSHNDHNYKPNTKYVHLVYMTSNNHLYPTTNAKDRNSLSNIKHCRKQNASKHK